MDPTIEVIKTVGPIGVFAYLVIDRLLLRLSAKRNGNSSGSFYAWHSLENTMKEGFGRIHDLLAQQLNDLNVHRATIRQYLEGQGAEREAIINQTVSQVLSRSKQCPWAGIDPARLIPGVHEEDTKKEEAGT